MSLINQPLLFMNFLLLIQEIEEILIQIGTLDGFYLND
jgi:hypothetical protein